MAPVRNILVTDFRMDGMNGVELAQKIHERQPQIPVIIVTGYGPVDGGKDVNACLQKEELFPALLEKIKLYLGEKPGSATIKEGVPTDQSVHRPAKAV